MIAVDWLGFGLSAVGLGLCLRGRWRPVRAVAAVLLGEVGRAVMLMLLLGQVTAVVAAGAFSRYPDAGTGPGAVEVAGLWVGAVLALAFGRTVARDTVLYALLGSLLVLILLGLGVLV